MESEEKALDLVLHLLELSFQGTILVRQNCDGYDVPGDAAGSAEVSLPCNIYIGNVLVLAEKRQVQDDFKWLRVGCQYHQISDAAIKSLRCFIGSLFQLLHGLRLVDQAQDCLAHLVVGLWPGSALLNGFIVLWHLLLFFFLLGFNWFLDIGFGVLGGLLGFLLLLLFLILFVLLALLVFLDRVL